MARPEDRQLFRSWLVAFTAGELLGFVLIPVLGGVVALALTRELALAPRAIVLYLVAVVGGFGEGATLAAFQHQVLRRVFPQLRRGRWVACTGVAAGGAWAAGMLAPTLDDVIGIGTTTQVAIWIPASVLILFSIGGVQARLLASHCAGAWRWLVANIVGWLLGLPWTFVLPALVPDDSSPAIFFAAFIVAGLLMAVTASAITGRTLVRLQVHARSALLDDKAL